MTSEKRWGEHDDEPDDGIEIRFRDGKMYVYHVDEDEPTIVAPYIDLGDAN